MWVFLFHAGFTAELPILRDGYVGVDLFFMLSGFILFHAHPGTGWPLARYRRFLQARIARIFPMHIVALALTVLVVESWPGFIESFGSHGVNKFTLVELVASLFLVQNWGLGEPAAWNAPSWSLSAEWLASLAFPCFVFGAAQIKKAWVGVTLGLLAIVAFLGFLTLTHNPSPGVVGRAGLVRLFFDFSAGALTYRAYALGYRAGALAGLAAACCVVAGLSDARLTGLILFAFPTTILLAAQTGNPVSAALATQPLRVMGELSYSFYLLHWILLMVTNRTAEALHVDGWWLLPWDAGLFALVLALSALTYRWIEVPARDALRPRREQPARAAAPAR